MTPGNVIARVAADTHAMNPPSELMYALSVAWTLTQLGIPSVATTADLAFEDSVDQGLRVFTFTVDDHPRDRHGHRGWPAILAHAVYSRVDLRARPWFIVEGQDPQSVMNDEISLQPGVLEKAINLARPVLAAMQAQVLENTTPAPVAVRPGPRL